MLTTRPETNDRLRLVFVGRLVADKNLDRIIAAVAESDGRPISTSLGMVPRKPVLASAR